MKNGVLVINKPEGITSRDVVNKLNRIFETKRIGHTGTLDPLATGVLVVAIGKKHFVTRDMVKRGAVVIDVGINRVDGKLYGDVNYDDVYSKVKKITPVPGGVGPMTVVMLMKNVIESYEKQNS